MNYRLIIKTLGTILQIESVCMLICMLISLRYGEDPTALAIGVAASLIIGTLLSHVKVHVKRFYPRDGIITVAIIWIAMSVIGGLPFFFYGHEFHSLIDCIFESASGFTTTGATILSDIESVPHGLLFWRSMTHFIGGMGVLVFAIAILPAIGDRAHNLFSAESTGPSPGRIVSTVGRSAKILYAIYVVFTIAETAALRICGLPWFDSATTAFATAGTGGFSVLSKSIGGYNNLAAEIVVTVFMLLFSVNFSLYFLMLTKQFRRAILNSELLFFLGVTSSSILLVTIDILNMAGSVGKALRFSSFNVLSVISTSGFGVGDFDMWPTFSKCILMCLMICGACGGSTGGGIKCTRVIILIKSLRCEMRRIQHPHSVNVVTMDGKMVPESVISNTAQFFFAYFCILICGTAVIALDKADFTTSMTAVLACISNVGPGFGRVGPTCNYDFFSDFSKGLLSLIMIAGRLEIFPILVLFSRSTWKRI